MWTLIINRYNRCILLINFVLGKTPTEEESLTVIWTKIVFKYSWCNITCYEILEQHSQSVQWLEENFPELNTKERLSKLNKSQFFSK